LPTPLARPTDDLFMPEHTQTKSVHKRIAFVRLVKIDLARDRRDAKAISVMPNTGDNAAEQTAVLFASTSGHEALAGPQLPPE
jgi:hypothetical protein